jgi:hypothetical protein
VNGVAYLPVEPEHSDISCHLKLPRDDLKNTFLDLLCLCFGSEKELTFENVPRLPGRLTGPWPTTRQFDVYSASQLSIEKWVTNTPMIELSYWGRYTLAVSPEHTMRGWPRKSSFYTAVKAGTGADPATARLCTRPDRPPKLDLTSVPRRTRNWTFVSPCHRNCPSILS